MVRLEMTVPEKASAVGVRVFVDGRKIECIHSINLEGFSGGFDLKEEKTDGGRLVWCEFDAAVEVCSLDGKNKVTIRRRNGKS